MAVATKIEWCTHTWNPWIGCTRVSAACDHCYAADMSHRYGWARFEAGAPRHRTSTAYWRQPFNWNRKAQANGVRESVFPSLCDPFDGEVADAWRDDLCDVARDTPQLDWLLLTKRPHLAGKYFATRKVPPNVWLGTTVEDQKMADLRIPQLLAIDATRRFLSIEPMLGPIDLYNGDPDPRLGGHKATQTFIGEWWERGDAKNAPPRRGVDWVIAGGESGPKARPSHPDWFRSLRDQCAAAEVPFFFKQWGEWAESSEQAWIDDDGSNSHMLVAPDGRCGDTVADLLTKPRGTAWTRRAGKKAAGAMLDGKLYREFPWA